MRHEINHPMVHAARDRAQVTIRLDNMERRGVLVAWEPKVDGRRRWGKARVQFSSGKCATVDTHRVALIDTPEAQQ
jgi:hypothetical protein